MTRQPLTPEQAARMITRRRERWQALRRMVTVTIPLDGTFRQEGELRAYGYMPLTDAETFAHGLLDQVKKARG